MAILMTLWSTLLGNKKARTAEADNQVASKVASQIGKSKFINKSTGTGAKFAPAEKKAPALTSTKANQLEKRKLLSTRRTVIECLQHDKLDLNHVRARINNQTPEYAQHRERQQQAISRWFGQPAALLDEAALTRRLADPVRVFDFQALEAQFEQTLNFTDINLPDHYGSEMPPLVVIDDEIPELEELLARLQIVDQIEMLEEELLAQPPAQPSNLVEPDAEQELETESFDEIVELHLVAPITLVESEFAAPVELIKHRRKSKKGQKGRRSRNRDAVRA